MTTQEDKTKATGGKQYGKVKWFNNAKGYGFIIEDGKSEDLFAHFSAIVMEGYKTLKAGQPVRFDTVQGPKGQHAVNISTVTELEIKGSPTTGSTTSAQTREHVTA